MTGINWVAWGAATLSCFVLGGIWYGPLFGRAWMALVGISEQAIQQANMAKIYGTTFVLQAAAAFMLAQAMGPDAHWLLGLHWGLMAGVWVAIAFGVGYLFEQRPFKLWAINAGYNLCSFAVMGTILGAW
ncbi:DUF1761 domain-containing protein [Simiduia agarivorans]|uniref:DUF1761 domain-containing protein n=1 Tax=Simiduia agarivorans (strain DSM 21679 / JCM 13881 / BCRC 17597 / SA1) TaxID=1117647 RepID=K4KNY3_SIMAS|nr:DUF1761 domain-containing protein [Simiduia agarivorans]AFV00890.1 hypothetical protein M5M_18805 [Simiduia agarivorans SA1 = DSM 21679]